MKAACYYGKEDVRVEQVPDPQILNPRDAIVKVTSTAICGSDLHLYDGYIPTMERGDILGHEFMGEVVEVGREVNERSRSATASSCRSRSPAATASSASKQLWSLCDNSNPNAAMAEKLYGYSRLGPVRLLAPLRRLRRRPGRVRPRAVRRRRADQGPRRRCSDEQVLFLSDIFPTGYMAAENCDIQPGDTVAVWGCGPVGQFAIKSAYLLGAERVIAIDRFPERLRMAARRGRPRSLDYEEVDVLRGAARDDRRPRPGRVHRRRRPGGARHDARRVVRPGQDDAATWRPTGRTRCARRSRPAARAARSRSPASTAACSTSSRSAPRSPRG